MGAKGVCLAVAKVQGADSKAVCTAEKVTALEALLSTSNQCKDLWQLNTNPQGAYADANATCLIKNEPAKLAQILAGKAGTNGATNGKGYTSPAIVGDFAKELDKLLKARDAATFKDRYLPALGITDPKTVSGLVERFGLVVSAKPKEIPVHKTSLIGHIEHVIPETTRQRIGLIQVITARGKKPNTMALLAAFRGAVQTAGVTNYGDVVALETVAASTMKGQASATDLLSSVSATVAKAEEAAKKPEDPSSKLGITLQMQGALTVEEKTAPFGYATIKGSHGGEKCKFNWALKGAANPSSAVKDTPFADPSGSNVKPGLSVNDLNGACLSGDPEKVAFISGVKVGLFTWGVDPVEMPEGIADPTDNWGPAGPGTARGFGLLAGAAYTYKWLSVFLDGGVGTLTFQNALVTDEKSAFARIRGGQARGEIAVKVGSEKTFGFVRLARQTSFSTDDPSLAGILGEASFLRSGFRFPVGPLSVGFEEISTIDSATATVAGDKQGYHGIAASIGAILKKGPTKEKNKTLTLAFYTQTTHSSHVTSVDVDETGLAPTTGSAASYAINPSTALAAMVKLPVAGAELSPFVFLFWNDQEERASGDLPLYPSGHDPAFALRAGANFKVMF